MNKSHIKKSIQIIIISCFLFLIFLYFHKHQEELKLLTKVRLSHVLLLIAPTLAILYFHARNVLMILRKTGLKNINFLSWFRIFITARYINFHITQGRILYMLYKLKKDYNFAYTRVISVTAFLSWYYTLNTLFFCFLLLISFHTAIPIYGFNLLPWLFATIIFVFLIPFLLILFFRIPLRQPALARLREKINQFPLDFKKNLSDLTHLLKITVFCFFQFIAYLYMVHIGFKAISHNLEISSLVLFTVVLIISKYYSIVPGNIGVTEMLCGALTVKMGGELSNGIIVSSLIRIVDYLVVMLLGIIFSRSLSPVDEDQLKSIKNAHI